MCRKSVNTTYAHTVQTTTDFVRTLVKLTSGMQYCHNNLKSRLVQLLVLIYWDTAAVVLNCYRLVFVDGYLDVRAIASHSLIDRVVNSLIYEVVKSLLAYVADVHRRALAHCLKSFKNLDITCRVVALGFLYFCHYAIFDV